MENFEKMPQEEQNKDEKEEKEGFSPEDSVPRARGKQRKFNVEKE